ncbi:response regulator [Endothiovibrio diazotrophicus]
MMNETFEHRVMIVDDDIISSGPLEITLQDTFEVVNVASGEAALARMADFRPEVVLLDINMPGLDGYETCRRLRAMEIWVSPEEQPAVIFVSSHDTLEERLQAYDCGGDDFVTKPGAAEEVVRKVQSMVKLVSDRKRLQTEKDSVQQLAMGFLANMGESGTSLHYMRNSLSCKDMEALAALTIAAAAEYGLTAHLQLRPPGECLTFVDAGHASPLEESVFAQVRKLDRIFQFRRQMVVNYPHVSLLVRNMPIEDEERCGRLRDHLALIAEGCESSALALIRSAEIEERTRRLHATAVAAEKAIGALRDQYRDQQAETTVILHQLNERVIGRMYSMGLSESQEEELQELLTSAVDETLELFQSGLDFDAQLGGLMEILSPSGESGDAPRQE